MSVAQTETLKEVPQIDEQVPHDAVNNRKFNLFSVTRRKALLSLADCFFCPQRVLPVLSMTPLALLLPPNSFRLEFEDRAFFLKHPLQNLARGEAALFLQRGQLHFLIALAFVLTANVMGVETNSRTPE